MIVLCILILLIHICFCVFGTSMTSDDRLVVQWHLLSWHNERYLSSLLSSPSINYILCHVCSLPFNFARQQEERDLSHFPSASAHPDTARVTGIALDEICGYFPVIPGIHVRRLWFCKERGIAMTSNQFLDGQGTFVNNYLEFCICTAVASIWESSKKQEGGKERTLGVYWW